MHINRKLSYAIINHLLHTLNFARKLIIDIRLNPY